MNPAMTFDIAAELNALIAAAPPVVMYEIRDMAFGVTTLTTRNEREAAELVEAWNYAACRERYRVFPG